MQDFFKVITRTEFQDLLLKFPNSGAETVPLTEAAGRITAEDIASREYLPLADRSCMDGYAVRAKDVFGASEANPAYLECDGKTAIDEVSDQPVKPGRCLGIATGGLLPPGADAVVMVEHTHDMGGGTIEVRSPAAPGENVMMKGEDAEPGRMALSAGTELRPQETGLLAALGFSEVKVGMRPKVGIISTGDELIPVEDVPRPGQVRDVNSHALAAMAAQAGGVPKLYGIVPDSLEQLVSAVKTALMENDVVLLSGGSSIGMRDLTVETLESLPQGEILAHGVALKPGKPTILARVGSESDAPPKAVIGLPGQVTSAQVVMLVLVCPFLKHLAGHGDPFSTSRTNMRRAELAVNSPSPKGREDYLRVRLVETTSGNTSALPKAEPVLGKSGLLRTMVQADGLVRIPSESEGVYQGEEVDVLLI